MSSGVKSINILSELDRLKVHWVSGGENEIKVCCPVHEDSTPSASLNVKDHVWQCFVPTCGASGDFVSLLAYMLKSERRVVLAELQSRYPSIGGVSELPSQTVEKFHAALKDAGPLLGELKKRGVTDDMMREARLGFHDGRITIPVFDEHGKCVNIRRYLPGAPGPQKMRNTTGHGAPALYRINTLKQANTVLVCGGEMKALVAGTLLADHGIAAVCSTGGEGHWKEEWTTALAGKSVAICLDVDDAGVAGARRIAMAVHNKAKEVKIVHLPLDKTKFPKGDINDWVGQCGASASDLAELIEKTIRWIPPSRQIQARGEPKILPLEKAISNSSVGELVEVHATVAASDQTPFLVPHDVDIECGRDQPGCHMCPVRLEKVDANGWVRLMVESGSAAILGMINATARDQRDRLSEALGIPQCKTVKFTPRTHHIAHDVRLTPPLDMAGGKVSDAWYPAIIVSQAVPDLNIACRMRGAVYPHPKTQQAVALINELEEVEDSLSSFSLTPADVEEMKTAFQPAFKSITSLTDKVNTIVADLEANVTWIYCRPEIHIALDLAWHSALMFNFGGRQINGWLNMLLLGDSAQGKSECAARLTKHYGAGDKVDCKNATVAGLLGGLEQLGNRWFVRWGTIPARDRMLVVLEELKGASTEVLSKLTEMRSSGIAEIPKIERRKALARTRLVMISNPRTPRPMGSFHFGVEAVLELIGSLEDVRRFDFAVAVSRDDVPDSVINTPSHKRQKVEHVVTTALSRKLVLWAWTRTSEQITFTDGAVETVVESSKKLVEKFTEEIPLVDKGTIRHKLARMAVAIAARTFSTEDGETLVVRAEHVRFVHHFLDGVYSSKVMGYDDYSAAHKLMSTIQDPDDVVKAIRGTRHPIDLATVLLRRDTISMEDIMSAASLDYDGGRTLLSMFVRKGALLRTSRTEYAKNPEFITLLKKIRSMDHKQQQDTTKDDF